MKRATLVLPIQAGRIWLGRKITGEIGVGTWNAPGGKIEPGESVLDCAVREVWEEIRVLLDPAALKHVATIDFHAGDFIGFSVEVFRAVDFDGQPQASDAMDPVKDFPTDALPVDEMLSSDRDWFLRAVAGDPFCADVYYRGPATGYLRTEFGPYRRLIE